MDQEDLNGVMQYEFDDIKKSGILDFGFQIKQISDNDYTK